jgi:hypothetical protein
MRRVLLGGLGLALGVFGRPALAQQLPGRPAAPYGSTAPAQPEPTNRAARLGRPEAVPTAEAPDPGVSPAGLVARGQAPPGVVPSPLPVPGPVVGGQPPIANPLPQPRRTDQQPAVTEVRDAGTRPAPVAQYTGGPFYPGGAGIGQPVGVQDGPVMVPPVGPMDGSGGIMVPTICPDDPLCGGPAPGMEAINRVGGADRWWVSAEYLAWWTRSTQLPVLATTGPPITVTSANGSQVIPPPGVPILSGSFGDTLHGGARFGIGYWFGDDYCRGIDARFLFLFRNGTGFTTNTTQFPVLGRPFFNVNTPVGPSADIVGFPGVANGGISAHLENSLWGAEVNYRRNLLGVCNPCARLDGLVGFRYLNFKEQLTISEAGFIPPGSPLLATGRAPLAMATDQFRAENNFYGGQIGLVGEVHRGRWFVNGRASVAFGTVFQTAEINGGQLQGFPGGPVTASAGGLLALPGANIGTFTQNRFAVLPEVGLNVGYQFTPRLRMFVGYDFLYLSSVLRPANVIDPNVDAARIPNFMTSPPPPLPGIPRPAPQLRTTDFWAQGINFGMSWTW